MKDVVPNYFVQSKYESFTRQLNGWGFKRLHQSGNDFNCYYHECFLRRLSHLVPLMNRVPGNLGKLLPHVEGEPNFYEVSFLLFLVCSLLWGSFSFVSYVDTVTVTHVTFISRLHEHRLLSNSHYMVQWPLLR